MMAPTPQRIAANLPRQVSLPKVWVLHTKHRYFEFWITSSNAAICRVGSTSPCNSDDERKQRFIEKGTVQSRAACPLTFEHFKMAAVVWFVLFEPHFQWSLKAGAFPRRLPMTLVVYHPDVIPSDYTGSLSLSLSPSLSVNDSVLTTLCLNPPSICASCANERQTWTQEIDSY